MTKNLLEIIFIGDIVGKPGRLTVKKYINLLKDGTDCETNYATIKSGKPDFIVANVENASHGFGLTLKNYNELDEIGIDAFTSGNHIWDKKEVFSYIESSEKLIRPLNYPEGTPGVGSRIFEVGTAKIGIINLLGRVFMSPIDSPWEILEKEVKRIKEITPIVIVDFHAEATAEKMSFGYFADSLGVSAVLGTHTHVPTADEKILNNGCAYITDVGFCGASNGVIGMDFASSFKRLKTNLPERFDVAPFGPTELNGVKILINKVSGKVKSIKRIKFTTDISEEKIMKG